MPVFDVAANQVQISPVSSYYEGKAIRLALKNKELANQAIQTDIEMAPRAMAVDEQRAGADVRRAETDAAQEARMLEQWESIKDTEDGKHVMGFIETSAAAYEQAIAQGRGETEARAFAFQTGLDFADTIIPGSRDQAAAALSEKGFEPSRFDPIKMKAMLGERPVKEDEKGTYKAKDTYVGDDGKEYHGWYDDKGTFHKTDILAKTEDSGEPVAFSAPVGSEIEAAEALVDQDETLDELDTDQKRVAAQMLASDIKQLQKAGKSYDEAAAMALAGVKAKVGDEKSRIFGSKKVLDVGGKGLADNEYKGSDGHIYVETADGWRRKD